MTTTQETYSWQLKLDRSMFDDLQYQSWQDGFREPDQIVVRLINQYLKRYSNKNRIMHDVFHQEIEAIVSYTRVLAFVHKDLERIQRNIDLFFSQLVKMEGKAILNQYMSREVTPGRIVRFFKSDLAKRLDKVERRNIFHWSVCKFKTSIPEIVKAYLCELGKEG